MINNYINQHGRRLYGLCLKLCQNTADADDLYQETWLKVLKNISKFDDTKEFEPWLTKICVNIHRNMLRRSAVSPVYNGFSTTQEKDRIIDSKAAAQQEDYSDLHDAINSLPEKLITTIILFYFRDMDINSTAEVLQIPSGTVKSRLNKARKLLKEALGNEADIPF